MEHSLQEKTEMTAERLREIVTTLSAQDSVWRSNGRVFLGGLRFEKLMQELREHANQLARVEHLPLCAACEVGDHEHSWICIADMKCACACHTKVV